MALKILVVDDSAPDRVNLETVLNEAGYSVVAASSGAEALTVATSESPDMIFMDIVMGDMDGYQACRKLKESDGTRDIPVVMVTSKAQKVDRMWATQQGATGYVTKPYTSEQICEQIVQIKG